VVKVDAQALADGSTVVRVHDNGIGIPPEQTERIFDKFTRLHNKRDYAGSGLGLSICRRIAELHQGNIRVISHPGQGSCFELQLPARTPEHTR
jgi:signal transduction histidine kinase